MTPDIQSTSPWPVRKALIRKAREKFAKKYNSRELDSFIEQNSIKYFSLQPNGNKFPGGIIRILESGSYDSHIIVLKVKELGILIPDDNNPNYKWLNYNFNTPKEYESFLHVIVQIIIDRNFNGVSSADFEDHFIRFFPEIFGVLDINKKANELPKKFNFHPIVNNAVKFVREAIRKII